ncbi:unnamed protein product [Caenorhabditis angaria]|uniref:Domain of unknown function DX domain-containing protein n=1 Tax=Caenorhabditis angaria TaxID=860376 RepID=A0A9P1IN06_9PELO|nr:unnamed protein product [Caenorhabditis angaria]
MTAISKLVITKYGQIGICLLKNSEHRCCPNKLKDDDFRTDIVCDETQQLTMEGVYYCNLNSDCAKGSYCVRTRNQARIISKTCFVIDPPKEEDNTMLIIIIVVVVVVVLIAIIGIVATVLIIKKKKKGKGGQNEKKGKPSKEKTEKNSKEKTEKSGSTA